MGIRKPQQASPILVSILLRSPFAKGACTFCTYTQLQVWYVQTIMSDQEIEEKCRSRKQCIRHLDCWSGNCFKVNIKTARVSNMRLKTRKNISLQKSLASVLFDPKIINSKYLHADFIKTNKWTQTDTFTQTCN